MERVSIHLKSCDGVAEIFNSRRYLPGWDVCVQYSVHRLICHEPEAVVGLIVPLSSRA